MSTKAKNVVLSVLMAVLLLGFFGWNIAEKDVAYSNSERRPLAIFPELTLERVLTGEFMKDFEPFTLDQFPMRDTFRSIKAIFSNYVFMNMDNNDVILEDGHISKLEYPLKEDMMDHAADRFGYIYNSFIKGKNAKVYLSVVPDKNLYLAENGGYLAIDYGKLASGMRDRMDYAEYIDVYPLLSADDYYCTDSHWKQENIVDVAQHLATSMGAEFKDDFTVTALDNPFFGTYYAQAALPGIDPDTIKYLTDDAINNCTVKGVDMNTGKYIDLPVYDMEKANGKDPYEMFLAGSQPFLVITNPLNKSGKELVIFRDSYGSSLTPLLIQSYSKITVADIRYMYPQVLRNMVNFNNADVLFVYSSLLLNNSIGLK